MNDSTSSAAGERYAIGAEIEFGAPAIAAVIESGIRLESITSPFFRRVHEVVLRLHATGLPINTAAVWETLKPTESETQQFLELTDETRHSLTELSRVCAELRSLAVRRETCVWALALGEAARNNPDGMPEIISRLLATYAESERSRTWAKICDDAAERARALIAGEANTNDFISWGWSQLDARFKPLRRCELAIVAARPSVGKSSLLRGITQRAARAGRHVLFETLEVSADDVADQMASARSGIAYGELAQAHQSDQADFQQALVELRAAPLSVFEDRSLAGIIARVKAVHATRPLDVVAIDYLGKIAECEPTKNQTKTQAIGRVTGALKALAMELRIVVLCAAQLNRNSAADDNREPKLTDLRDSGDIEQDADRVVLIHRPDECPFTKQAQNVLDDVRDLPRYGCALIQAKGRNVGTGYGAVWFNRRLARFEFET